MYRAVLLSGVRDYYDGLFFGGDGAAAVGLQQFLQIGYPAGNSLTVVDIPDELAKVKIGELELSGRIDEEGIDRIRNLFPDTEIRVNGRQAQ